MFRIVIFTDDPGWHGRELVEAFSRMGASATFASLTACRIELQHSTVPIYIPGFDGQLPDAVFVRGVPGGSLEEVVFYLDILHILKKLGIPVYNDGRAIEASVDKGMTSFLLANAGIPSPPTWMLRDREHALATAEAELQQGHTLISKPLFGSQGEGIRRLDKSTDLLWLTSSQGIYYFQRFLHSHGEGYSDIRVFVINQQAVAAMRRRGISWLNNVARGAQCESLELTSRLSELAVNAVAALEMDYAGVDLIELVPGEYAVIEVNSVPAWKGLQTVTQFNIADYLAEDLLAKLS